MSRGTTLVGRDVHRSTINVAVLEAGNPAPIESVLENRATAVAKLAQKLKWDFGDAVAGVDDTNGGDAGTSDVIPDPPETRECPNSAVFQRADDVAAFNELGCTHMEADMTRFDGQFLYAARLTRTARSYPAGLW